MCTALQWERAWFRKTEQWNWTEREDGIEEVATGQEDRGYNLYSPISYINIYFIFKAVRLLCFSGERYFIRFVIQARMIQKKTGDFCHTSGKK